jgi:periplasmic divalent cation tolerance protein
MTEFRLVLSNVASEEEAESLARSLLTERLVACVNILPRVRSLYQWRGAIEEAQEWMLLMKTSALLVPTLERRVVELHSYETPEFLVLPVEAGFEGYLHWLGNELRGAGKV